MNGADIIAVIILIALAIAVIVYLLHWLYRRSSKEISFVRTGMGGEKVVLSGGAFVIPIIHNVTMVGMRTVCIEVRRNGEKSLITKNRMRVELVAEFYLRVKPTEAAVSIAAQSLGKRTLEADSMRELVQGRFVDALAIVAASMSMDEMQEKRGQYVKAVKNLAEEHLSQTGLELETVSLTGLDQAPLEMFNPSNAFDAEGLTQLTQQIEQRKKDRNDIEQETLIQIRDKNLETEKLALEIDRESEFARLKQALEISTQRNQQRTAIARDRAEREREAEEVQIRAEEAIELVKISQHQVLEVERRLTETRLITEIESRRRDQNEIERNAAVEIEKLNLETEKKLLELRKLQEFSRIEQEQEIAIKKAQQKAEITSAEASRYREAELSQITAEQDVRSAEIQQQKNIDVVRIAAEEEARSHEIEKVKRIKLNEYERDLTLMKKSKDVYEVKIIEEQAHAEAIKATESVVTSRDQEIADRKKKIELIMASAVAESSAIKVKTNADAETFVAEQRTKAEDFATLAAKHRYEVDAAGHQMLNQAENLRSEASRESQVRMQLATNLEGIIRESVKPIEGIDTIKIYEVNGLPGIGHNQSRGGSGAGDEAMPGGEGRGTNFADSVVNSALRYRAQLPLVDNLLEEIGMAPGEITNIGNILNAGKRKKSNDGTPDGDGN